MLHCVIRRTVISLYTSSHTFRAAIVQYCVTCTSHLELLSLPERKASLNDLLSPHASLARVEDHLILVKTRVDMQCKIMLIIANYY